MSRRIIMYTSGLIVAKPGRDAGSGNGEDFLVDTTTRNTRAYLSGRISGAGNYVGDYVAGFGIFQIVVTHGLGYIPLFNAQHVGGGFVDIIINTGNIYAQFYQNYGSGNSPPASANMSGYVDYSLFYDRWV